MSNPFNKNILNTANSQSKQERSLIEINFKLTAY